MALRRNISGKSDNTIANKAVVVGVLRSDVWASSIVRSMLRETQDIRMVKSGHGGMKPNILQFSHVPDVAVIHDLDSERCRLLKLRYPSMRMLVLDPGEPGDPKALLASGADGVIGVPRHGLELEWAIRDVVAGGMVMPATMVRELWQLLFPAVASGTVTAKLGETRNRILALVALGMANKQIGAQLNISEFTVRNHLCKAFRILGVNSRGAAVAQWLRLKEPNQS